jgi:hypothetical protein
MIDIYIINLKKRTDRLSRVQKDFSNYNLIVIEAIEDTKLEGWKGCFKSHIKCILTAKEKNLPYIIVIEDDCKISNDTSFDFNLRLILNYLQNNMDKWNIFLGGVSKVWNYTNLIELNHDLKLLNINEGKTAHFMIYNSNCYDYYLNLELINTPIDKCWHNKLIGLVSIPFIAIQYSDFSNIENKLINYDSRFASIETSFINLINKNK